MSVPPPPDSELAKEFEPVAQKLLELSRKLEKQRLVIGVSITGVGNLLKSVANASPNRIAEHFSHDPSRPIAIAEPVMTMRMDYATADDRTARIKVSAPTKDYSLLQVFNELLASPATTATDELKQFRDEWLETGRYNQLYTLSDAYIKECARQSGIQPSNGRPR